MCKEKIFEMVYFKNNEGMNGKGQKTKAENEGKIANTEAKRFKKWQ